MNIETKTYTFTADASAVDEMTEEQYRQLCSDAQAVCETPEEFGDYVYIMQAVNEAGEAVWLGIR